MKSKALLLLFIFLLNTASGFACALRMADHERGEEVKEHHHEGNETTKHGHLGDETKGIHHQHQQVSPPSAHDESLLSETSKNDSCCQKAVNNFNSLAKITPQSGKIILLARLTFIGAYHQFFLKPVSVIQTHRFATIDGRRRPPKYPIRIALQSFQI